MEDERDSKLKEQLKDILLMEIPSVNYDDIIGLENAIQSIKENVILPILYPQLFEGKRKKEKGTLFFGPPGAGKKLLLKAAYKEANSKIIWVSCAKMANKSIEEKEKLIKALFEYANKNKPIALLFEEIELIFGTKEESQNEEIQKLATQLLMLNLSDYSNELIGINLLATSQNPWDLLPPIRRRFGNTYYISLPETKDRKMMIKYNLKNKYNIITEDQFDKLGELTEGYSYSDINNLLQEVINISEEKCQNSIYFKYLDENHIIPCKQKEQGSFEIKNKDTYDKKNLITPIVIYEYCIISLQKIKPTVSKTILEKCEKFNKGKAY